MAMTDLVGSNPISMNMTMREALMHIDPEIRQIAENLFERGRQIAVQAATRAYIDQALDCEITLYRPRLH